MWTVSLLAVKVVDRDELDARVHQRGDECEIPR
jgi:hypothetical protein